MMASLLKKIENYMIARYRAVPLSKGDYLGALVCFGISLAVYVYTLSPTLPAGDSGELVTAVQTLGVAHSPGYPLLMWVGKLFTFLPLGSVAHRLNFFSAFCGAFTVGFLFLCSLKLLSSTGIKRPYGIAASALGALSFAFSKVFWSQAVVLEVYTMAAVFYPLLWLLLLRWMDDVVPRQKKEREEGAYGERFLMAFGFVFGLGVVAHLTTLMTEIAFGFWFLSIWGVRIVFGRDNTREQFWVGVRYLLFLGFMMVLGYRMFYDHVINPEVNVLDLEDIKTGVTFFLVSQGLLFMVFFYERFLKPHRLDPLNTLQSGYRVFVSALGMFYLAYASNFYGLIRSYAHPVINWGGINENTGFWHMMSKWFNHLWRKQYGDQGRLPLSWQNVGHEAHLTFLTYNVDMYGVFFSVVAIGGFFYLCWKNAFYGLLTLVAFVSFNLQMILTLRVDVYGRFAEAEEVFYLFSAFVMALWISAGFAGLMGGVQRGLERLGVGARGV